MIILFGADGQLGQELVNHAGQTGTPLIAFGRNQVDIADARAVAQAINRDGIKLAVNAAAYTKVDQAESEPEKAFRANALGPAVVGEACAKIDLPLVHISSDYVFDGSAAGAHLEAEPMAPRSAYGRSKAAGEEAVRRLHPKHVILRTSWLYGVYGHNFLKMMIRMAAAQEELRIVDDQWGSPTSTTELAEAIFQIRSKLGSESWGTYHFGGEGETTRYGFASHIVDVQARYTGRRPSMKAISTAEFPTKARRPRNSVLNSSRFAEVFGFSAEPWEHAVDRTIAKLYAGVRP